MIKKIQIHFLFLLVLLSCTGKLIIEEDKYKFVTPAYRVNSQDTTKVSLSKRFFTRHYADNKVEFDYHIHEIMCQAVNDSIPITQFEFVFVDGLSHDWYNPLVTYVWRIEKPNILKKHRNDVIELPTFVPFNCILNENYKLKDK